MQLGNAQVEITLHAALEKPFGAREVWDVMYSMGLEWGDMDLFHWGSPNLGGDRFFSVETTTEPGYFLPEDAAANKRFGDLVFAFVIPSTLEPARVAAAVLRGAKYAQRRLGGTLTMGESAPLDDAALLGYVRKTVKAMRDAGVTPGSDEANHLR
jgi:cell division protein ZipA